MADKFENLSAFQLDVLREIGNIGAGNAATSLSILLSDKISMSVPALNVVDISVVPETLGGPENPVVGIVMPVRGDVTGIIMLVLEIRFLHSVIRSLLNKDLEGIEKLSEMDISVFLEIGNILAGSYLNALSQLTGLKIKLSPPEICADMAGAVMSLPAAMFGMTGDKALIIQEDFLKGETITSHLIMVPELDSLNKILNCLGVA
jgi:chemotaxis protein CheC